MGMGYANNLSQLTAHSKDFKTNVLTRFWQNEIALAEIQVPCRR